MQGRRNRGTTLLIGIIQSLWRSLRHVIVCKTPNSTQLSKSVLKSCFNHCVRFQQGAYSLRC